MLNADDSMSEKNIRCYHGCLLSTAMVTASVDSLPPPPFLIVRLSNQLSLPVQFIHLHLVCSQSSKMNCKCTCVMNSVNQTIARHFTALPGPGKGEGRTLDGLFSGLFFISCS